MQHPTEILVEGFDTNLEKVVHYKVMLPFTEADGLTPGDLKEIAIEALLKKNPYFEPKRYFED
jgi:hypothetical protein